MTNADKKRAPANKDSFAAVAERLECDPDLEKFDKKLGKIAKTTQKPKTRS